MKAVVCDRYGPPDILKLEEIEKPVPGDSEVLAKNPCGIGKRGGLAPAGS